MIIYVVHWETYDTAGICKSISIKIPTGLMFFFLLLFHIADVCKNYMAVNFNFLHFCQLKMLTKLDVNTIHYNIKPPLHEISRPLKVCGYLYKYQEEEKELQEEKIGGKQEDNF